ncbi:hypothetical protein L1987_57380 [Smallanthus sonchifolius]|uniref:Uncharacterized protein n=1 Tax=Smallanthus sonchifolius TaxID=185202 RepID=A0ACB9DCN3_9ASTR|nr:hypothetical protein L1987_57380 [Smallanthus sonchifolius]
MTVLSEIGDKTFFAAAVMTILSAAVGMAAPNLDADIKSNGGTKSNNKDDDDLKKKNRPFLTQFFSPIFLKSIWSFDPSATIGLAAAENPMGGVVGGIMPSFVSDGCCFRREELGNTNIREIYCTIGRNSFHHLWSSIILFDNRIMILGAGNENRKEPAC